MPPYASSAYASVLDGSLRIQSSTNNGKYGNGSLELYGTGDHYLSTTDAAADLYLTSAKDISTQSLNFTILADTTATFTATTGLLTVGGADTTLTAYGVSGGAAGVLDISAPSGTVNLAGTSVGLTGTNIDLYGTNISCTGVSKYDTFIDVTSFSTESYHISSGTISTVEGVLGIQMIGSSGFAMFKGWDSASLVSTNGIAGMSGAVGATITAISGDASLNAPSGDAQVLGYSVEITAASGDAIISATNGDLHLTAPAKDVYITGHTGVTLSASAGVSTISAATGVTVTTGDGDATVTADNGDVIITAFTNATIIATNGTASIDGTIATVTANTGSASLIASTAAAIITGQVDASITANTGNASLIATAGDAIITADADVLITSNTNAVTITASNAVSLVSTNTTFDVTAHGDATITSSDNNVNLVATLGAVQITGQTTAALTATTGMVSVVGQDAEITANTGSATLGAPNGTAIVTGYDVNIESTGGNITVLSIGEVSFTGTVKNETFESAQQTYTADYNLAADDGVYLSSSASDFEAAANLINLQATTGTMTITGQTDTTLLANTGILIMTGAVGATLQADTGPINITAPGGQVNITGVTKYENFSSYADCTAATDYNIAASSGNMTFSAGTNANFYGGYNTHVRGANNVLVQCTGGNVELGATGHSIVSTADTISSTAVTEVSLAAPCISIVANTLSEIDAPTVEVGISSSQVTISQGGGTTQVQGILTVDGVSNLNDNVTITGDCTVSGNLTVAGDTTNINTTNLLVEDNIIVVNTASEAGRDPGILFTRRGVTGSPGTKTGNPTSLFWHEADQAFVLASTASGQGDPSIIKDQYSDLYCGAITATSVSLANFGTKTFQLGGQSGAAVTVTGINKTRGTYDFQIQSEVDNGSVYNYKMVKPGLTGPAVSFGVHAAGADDSQVWVRWDTGSHPQFYMKEFSTVSADPLNFIVTFTTVQEV